MHASGRATNVLLVLILAAGVGIVAMLASGAYGGPLDPPGPPTSTMKSLDEIPGSWSRRLDATNGNPGGSSIPAGCDSERFRCVLTYADCILQVCITQYPAVLDEETGLVWQQAPDTATFAVSWAAAVTRCGLANTGRRFGWRLPTAAELESLRDPTSASDPALFAGSPFAMNITGSVSFWTSSASAGLFSYVGFGQTIHTWNADPSTWAYVWCVRGATRDR